MSSTTETRFIPLDEGLAVLKSEGIDKIIAAIESGERRPFEPGELPKMYSLAYEMCTQPRPHMWSDDLYRIHGETVRSYVDDKLYPSFVEARRKDDAHVLAMTVRNLWSKHDFVNSYMRFIFSYLDRYHVRSNDLTNLAEVGNKHFRERILDDEVDENVRSLVLKLIRDEREGRVSVAVADADDDDGLIQDIMGMYAKLGVYKSLENRILDYKSLENRLLDETREFYGARQRKWAAECSSLPEYLMNVEGRLAKEEARMCRSGDLEKTRRKVLQICREELLEDDKEDLLSGFSALLRDGCGVDLGRFYRLFSFVRDGHVRMADEFRNFLSSAENDGNVRTEDKLAAAAFYGRYFGIVTTSFASEEIFLHPFLESYIGGRFLNPDIGRKVMEFL